MDDAAATELELLAEISAAKTAADTGWAHRDCPSCDGTGGWDACTSEQPRDIFFKIVNCARGIGEEDTTTLVVWWNC